MRKQTTGRRIQRLRLCLAGSLLAAAAVFLAAADAAASGRVQMTPGGMTKLAFTMRANVDYEITVNNENAIVTLVTYPEGNFVAGSADATFGFIVPHLTTAKNVFMIIRGQPDAPDGDADILIRGFQGSNTIYSIAGHATFTATTTQGVPSLAAGTHITTVEDNLGVTDTAVMVVDSTGKTVAFDDDDGIDKMSFVNLSAACSGGCGIIVGRFGGSGTTTLVWDESLGGGDTDRDGLSNEFETNVTHTSPSNADTDGDGIPDGYEVYGAVLAGSGRGNAVPLGGGKTGNLLKFPKYGADPLAQDIFVEIDWVPACPASDKNCCTGAPSTCMSGALIADGLKATTADLISAFNSISGAARVHFDAGIPTAAGDSNAMFGAWGGANRLGDGEVNFAQVSGSPNYKVTLPEPTFAFLGQDKDCFTDVVPARVFSGTFHHQIMIDHSSETTVGRIPELGTTLFESAACALVATGDGSIAHELGHNFNLRHGGFASAADGELNCKMNYGSIMSYPNQTNNTTPFAPGYSIGRFVNFAINGSLMDERNGLLVTNSTGILNVFYPGGSMNRGFSDPTNFPMGIDWNMDGRIETSGVRAPANWANTSCAAPYLRGQWRLMLNASSQDNTFLSSAALPVMTVAEASAASPQIYGVGKTSATTGNVRPLLLVGSGDASTCKQQGLGTCTFWSKREAVQVGIQPQSQIAVAGPLVAWRDVVGNLWYLRRGKSITGWLGPGFLASGLTGDPAVIEENGRVKVYAVDSSGFLRRWELDEATGAWPVSGEADYWENGTFVQAGLGIGIAYGVVRPSAGGGSVQGVFGAIPNRAKAAGAGKPMPVEFARRTSTTFNQTITVPAHTVRIGNGTPFMVPAYSYTTTVHQDRWQRFAAPGPAAAFSKPSLVYAPFDTSFPDDGRFYMTWVPGGTGFQSTTAFIVFTEGNDQTAPGCPATGVACGRRLLWMNNQRTPFSDPDNQSRDLRNGVGLSRFGASVAGVATDFLGSNYFPAADGIVNANFQDFEDNLLVRHNLPCSVHGQSCDESP